MIFTWFSIQEWFMLSKNPLMSASSTQTAPLGLLRHMFMYARASWHDLLGRNPKECLSALCSMIGSTESFTRAWYALSNSVGIPRGLMSFDPGFGIHTRLTGEAL